VKGEPDLLCWVVGKLVVYDHHICIIGAPSMYAPTDRFISGLVWSHGSKCKKSNFGSTRVVQIVTATHAETYKLSYKKGRSVRPTLPVKMIVRRKSGRDILSPLIEPYGPWDTCLNFNQMI